MKTYHIVIPRPDLGDVDLVPPLPTGDAALDAWTDRTTALIDRFNDARHGSCDIDAGMVALVLHVTSDVLYERLGAQVSFDKLDPAALMGIVVRTLPAAVGTFAEVLRDFYGWLTKAGEIDAGRGHYLACYFETLLELHGAGPIGIQPTRASRRATATLARRIAEARIRNEQRATRKPAA